VLVLVLVLVLVAALVALVLVLLVFPPLLPPPSTGLPLPLSPCSTGHWPAAGPAWVPCTHAPWIGLPGRWHQPQPYSAVHTPHVVSDAQSVHESESESVRQWVHPPAEKAWRNPLNSKQLRRGHHNILTIKQTHKEQAHTHTPEAVNRKKGK
jgi:hypothetical protein